MQVFGHYLHSILGILLQVETTESQETDHATIYIDQGGNATQLEQKILDKMTDHKVSDFVFKKSNHVVTPASTYPVKATSDTVSVNTLLLLQ